MVFKKHSFLPCGLVWRAITCTIRREGAGTDYIECDCADRHDANDLRKGVGKVPVTKAEDPNSVSRIQCLGEVGKLSFDIPKYTVANGPIPTPHTNENDKSAFKAWKKTLLTQQCGHPLDRSRVLKLQSFIFPALSNFGQWTSEEKKTNFFKLERKVGEKMKNGYPTLLFPFTRLFLCSLCKNKSLAPSLTLLNPTCIGAFVVPRWEGEKSHLRSNLSALTLPN